MIHHDIRTELLSVRRKRVIFLGSILLDSRTAAGTPVFEVFVRAIIIPNTIRFSKFGEQKSA